MHEISKRAVEWGYRRGTAEAAAQLTANKQRHWWAPSYSGPCATYTRSPAVVKVTRRRAVQTPASRRAALPAPPCGAERAPRKHTHTQTRSSSTAPLSLFHTPSRGRSSLTCTRVHRSVERGARGILGSRMEAAGHRMRAGGGREKVGERKSGGLPTALPRNRQLAVAAAACPLSDQA